MPIERSAEHPIFELGGNAITSYAAPARGSQEIALYRADVPPGGGLPPHTHDHFDVFTVMSGGGVFHLEDDATELAAGDSAVVPIGVRHFLEAGPEGASIVVAMLPGTRLIRDDRSELRSRLGAVMSHYFSNVTLFDGRSVRTKQGVHVAGGTIQWIGAHARAPRVARAASEVEGSGRTLTPGLIDCHVHLIFDGQADFEGESKGLTPARAAIKAARNAERHLQAGVTTVRDLGGLDGVVCEIGVAIEEGLTPGPRVLAAGRALTITGGHGHNLGLAREVDSPEDVRRAVREEIKAGARAIKVMATGGVLTPGIEATFTAFTPDELSAAVDEAHKWGRGVAAHAIGAEGILNAVLAGVDSVEHCCQTTSEIAREMKARGTFRSSTICALRGIVGNADVVPEYAVKKAEALEAESRDGFRRAVREGVRHVCGTDAGTPFNPHGNAPRELMWMVEWGMTPLKVMQAATANGAELLRLQLVGTIEEGKEADLVLFEGNPAEAIEHVLSPLLVVKAGDVVAGSID